MNLLTGKQASRGAEDMILYFKVFELSEIKTEGDNMGEYMWIQY